MVITPNLVSRPKMMVFFHCMKKKSKIYCFHGFSIVLYCLKTIEQWDFQKKDKGMLITIFLLDFWI